MSRVSVFQICPVLNLTRVTPPTPGSKNPELRNNNAYLRRTHHASCSGVPRHVIRRVSDTGDLHIYCIDAGCWSQYFCIVLVRKLMRILTKFIKFVVSCGLITQKLGFSLNSSTPQLNTALEFTQLFSGIPNAST